MSVIKEYNPPKKQSPKRIIFFKTFSILFSILLLCIIEFSLRIFNYGHDLRLFIEYPDDKDFLILNPDASKKYFTNQAIATTGNIEPFKKKKDANTLRIFVLGESTTIGYPYFHNGSFHRWLQYRLTHTFHDRNFEIINLSLTAVNSYTVYGFAKAVVDYEPDAVLIYSGHNEYYGALGVGSTEKMGGNPQLVNTLLYLRNFRLVQLMTNVYEKLQNTVSGDKSSSGGTRMKLMVADQKIAYGSDLYQRGIEQFRHNMDATLALLAQHNIPVFISNLVNNEKDLKPFVSFPVGPTKFPGFTQQYTLGVTAFTQKNYADAYTYFKAANQIYNAHGLCNFYLGRTAYLQKDFDQAKIYFEKAKDLDGLRFRAPNIFNDILSQLCRQYKNTHLIDTKAIFENKSAHGIIGDELILEHVHPNLRGYALLADAFYETMKKEKVISVNQVKEISFDHLLRTMPITKVDSLAGLYKVNNLKRNWPFTDVVTAQPFTIKSTEEKLAYDLTTQKITWQDALSTLYDYYLDKRDFEKARRTVEALALESPTDARYVEKAAMLSGELKDDSNAIFYFKKAFALAPSFDKARFLFVLFLKLDQPADALPYLDYAIEHNLSQFNLNPVKTYARQVIQLKKKLDTNQQNIAILMKIANAYYRMDNKAGAANYLQKVLTVEPDNKTALSLMTRLK